MVQRFQSFCGPWFYWIIELLILRNWSFDIFREDFSRNTFIRGALFDEKNKFFCSVNQNMDNPKQQ